jgi:hypothetical protein
MIQATRVPPEGEDKEGTRGKAERCFFYRGADKSLARPGRKQAAATEYCEVHISYLQS